MGIDLRGGPNACRIEPHNSRLPGRPVAARSTHDHGRRSSIPDALRRELLDQAHRAFSGSYSVECPNLAGGSGLVRYPRESRLVRRTLCIPEPILLAPNAGSYGDGETRRQGRWMADAADAKLLRLETSPRLVDLGR